MRVRIGTHGFRTARELRHALATSTSSPFLLECLRRQYPTATSWYRIDGRLYAKLADGTRPRITLQHLARLITRPSSLIAERHSARQAIQPQIEAARERTCAHCGAEGHCQVPLDRIHFLSLRLIFFYGLRWTTFTPSHACTTRGASTSRTWSGLPTT